MRLVLICLLLVNCGRSLSDQEQLFLAGLHGDTLDTAKVRIWNNAPLRASTLRAPIRPRKTCRERIGPPSTGKIVTSTPAGVVLFNRLWANPDFFLPDYVPEYPERLSLYQAMFFAHEMTHIWQWQNRALTGYHPLKAAREHRVIADPYLIDPDEERDFLDYGYEQQGAVVEEYLCCALLDPEAPRTARLRTMLAKYFPLQSLPVDAVHIGWKGVERKGICR